MVIYIVTSKEIISQFQRTFKEFKVDMGKSFTAVGQTKDKSVIDIKDGFVERFINETGKFCFKMGRAGLLEFYTMAEIDQQIWFYAEDEKIVVNFKKGTPITEKLLGSVILELENRTKSTNPNSMNSVMKAYYKKKSSDPTESIQE